MTTKSLIKESLIVLNICGLNPTKTNKKSKIRAYFTLIIMSCMIIESFLELVLDWKGLNSLDALAEFTGFYQIISKIITVLIKRKKFIKIFRAIEESFQPLHKYEVNLQNQIISTNNVIKKVMVFAVASGIVTVMVYFSKPILTNTKSLPLRTYNPHNLDNSINYGIAYVLQIIVLIFVVTPSLLGFDFLFISLITHIINELKLLNCDFSTISYDKEVDEESSLTELNALVDHHNLVLECIKDMNDIYSLLLLNQFLTCTFLVCSGLFATIAHTASSDLQNVIKAAGYLLVYLSMLFSYCSGGAYLTTQCHSIGDAVFMSDWWMQSQSKSCKNLLLVICRSQKMDRLTAGNMFDLNLKTFTSVIRTAFSFFMVIQAVFAKSLQNKQ